ncbi:hypothetical protein BDB01DRAFT_844522 [Pilobolus umbonatus]|nr:hypothetical protein BDB01DRAFT_844522 [Pilobolus umbonatus]
MDEYRQRVEQLAGTRHVYINENSPHQKLTEKDTTRTEEDEYKEKAQFCYDQGELNELRGHIDHALDYYTEAAELYYEAFKGYGDEAEKSKAKDAFQSALDKAEEMKNRKNALTVSDRSRPSSAHSNSHNDNILTQKLSSAEIDVLKVTSSVNNNMFLPWIDESDLKEKFSFKKRYIDPEGSLPLSSIQIEKFGGWKRPHAIMKHPRLINMISSTSIIQDIVTDCSFVASLCVAAAYEEKFKKQLITSCIYPQNKYGEPCYNPNGKYVIKLVYNGISRKIVVDDLLPVSRKGTLMCTFSTHECELWPSIIEKALMGGYDFPGSNSGIDLHCLTGWIPEHVFIFEKNFMADSVWERLYNGIQYGDALVTIATGDMTEEEATELGLVPTHAYAVIDAKVYQGIKLLKVKNPWSHKRWRGPYSHLDNHVWTSELREVLKFDPDAAEMKDDGIFWIDYDSVCMNFASIHLNWNPELFTYRWVLHSAWPESIGPKNDIYCLAYNPQFRLSVHVPDEKPAAVWLLLSKHITVTEENTDYITLHVYNDTQGERIYYPGTPFKEGTYVNSPHILVRFNAPPGNTDYTIVVSQHQKERSLYFSLRGYSLAPFKLSEVPIRYTIPQKVPPTQDPIGVLIMLEAPNDFPVHLMVVEGQKRVTSVSVRDILTESGPYRHGFCYCEIPNGMFKKVLHGKWVKGYSAMGCPSYETVPSMNVTIYEKHPTELFGKEIATSGPYTNIIQGVATSDVLLEQNETGYIIVVATHSEHIECEYTLTIYTDRPVHVKKER